MDGAAVDPPGRKRFAKSALRGCVLPILILRCVLSLGVVDIVQDFVKPEGAPVVIGEVEVVRFGRDPVAAGEGDGRGV